MMWLQGDEAGVLQPGDVRLGAQGLPGPPASAASPRQPARPLRTDQMCGVDQSPWHAVFMPK